MCSIVRIQIPRYAVVARSVRTVRGYIYLDDRVVLYVVVLGCRHTHRSICRQHDDSRMVGSHAYLVLCTQHTVRVFSAQLAFLDRERLLAVIKHRTDGGYDHFLSGGYVRRTAHYL